MWWARAWSCSDPWQHRRPGGGASGLMVRAPLKWWLEVGSLPRADGDAHNLWPVCSGVGEDSRVWRCPVSG